MRKQNCNNHFCPIHASFNNICSVVDCGSKVVDGHLICDNPKNQEIEQLHHERGQSHFQLHVRLQCAHTTIHPTGSESNSQFLSQHTMFDNDDEQFTVDPNGHVTTDSPEKVPQDLLVTKSRKVCAKFTWSRTHNKQLTVALCGMILRQDTMFGAEGIVSVAVSLPSFVSV